MKFSDPKVKAVFAEYKIREAKDGARLKELGAEGFALRDEFLLPVGEEVGWFLHSLIVARRPKRILELGTSYGYSTLFLADAAREIGAQVITMDLVDYKQDYARERLIQAGLIDQVYFRCGDAVEMTKQDDGVFEFVLLDIWKDLYEPCFNAFYSKLSEEGVICSDNMIYPSAARPQVRQYREAVRSKSDLQTALLPIGQGVELTVKWGVENTKL